MKSEKQMRKEAAKRLQRVQRDTRLILAAMRIEEEPGRYIVMCRVSGGFTGTREAPLKKDDRTRYFETREAAEKEAARLNAMPRYSLADFRYWVEAR